MPNADVRFTVEPMQHWSARGFFDRREALWDAFVIEAPGGANLLPGRSGYAKKLSDAFLAKYGKPRFSLLPLGAYEPRWFMQYVHMTPAEVIDTLIDLGQTCAMGTQHEVFPMADEAYKAPRQALTAAMKARGISTACFKLSKVGECFIVPLNELPGPIDRKPLISEH